MRLDVLMPVSRVTTADHHFVRVEAAFHERLRFIAAHQRYGFGCGVATIR